MGQLRHYKRYGQRAAGKLTYSKAEQIFGDREIFVVSRQKVIDSAGCDICYSCGTILDPLKTGGGYFDCMLADSVIGFLFCGKCLQGFNAMSPVDAASFMRLCLEKIKALFIEEENESADTGSD